MANQTVPAKLIKTSVLGDDVLAFLPATPANRRRMIARILKRCRQKGEVMRKIKPRGDAWWLPQSGYVALRQKFSIQFMLIIR